MPNELFTDLFKAPKVEEQIVKAAGSTHSLRISPNLRKAVETFHDPSNVALYLRWHATLLFKYLHSKCGQDPVLKAVLCKFHSAIQESGQTLAHGLPDVIEAQRRLVINASAVRDCSVFTPGDPFVSIPLFKGRCMSSVEVARSARSS